jgi:hypothetical protein
METLRSTNGTATEFADLVSEAVIKAFEDPHRTVLQLLMEPTPYIVSKGESYYRVWRGSTPTGQQAYMLVWLVGSVDPQLDSLMDNLLRDHEIQPPHAGKTPPNGDQHS